MAENPATPTPQSPTTTTPAPITFPINSRSEPLLASLQRLRLLREAEHEDIISLSPLRRDQPIFRLDNEGKTVVNRMPAAQIRLAFAIRAGVVEEDNGKLDAQAKKELAAAIADYPIHTYDRSGVISGTRRARNETEALEQVRNDVESAERLLDSVRKFRQQRAPAPGQTQTPPQRTAPGGSGRQSRLDAPAPGMDAILLAENLRQLEDAQQIGAQITNSLSMLDNQQGGNPASLTFRNARVGMGKKAVLS